METSHNTTLIHCSASAYEAQQNQSTDIIRLFKTIIIFLDFFLQKHYFIVNVMRVILIIFVSSISIIVDEIKTLC